MWDVGFLFVLLFVLCLYIVLVYYLRIKYLACHPYL